MPIDASIYAQQQAPPSPLANLSGALQVQSQISQLTAQRALDQAYAGAVKQGPDGSTQIDENSLFSHLPGHLIPGAMKSLADSRKAVADYQEQQLKVQAARNDLAGSLANTVEAAGYDPQTFFRGLKALQGLGAIDQQTALQYAQAGIDGGPTAIKAIIDRVKAGSHQQQQLSNAVDVARIRANGGGEKNPTEASLAAAAAGGDETAGKALDLLKGNKPSAEQDDQRYRNIQAAIVQKQPVAPSELAWARGYEKQKTLGPEASAAAAADRQATTIQQQTAQQGRAQAFTEAQAGRKEYSEKVALPYQTAMASAQTMRDTVAAAQSGNKVAANLQNLETAMSAIRAQGLNRINTTEIGVAANAGSLWDRIQGRVGSLVAGQPVPADLQKDMLQFADILEKSATAKYRKGRTSLLQVYPGAKLPDESLSAGAPAPSAKANPFRK